ncbi:MAG: response regulator [Leptospira sp.]|nr:response regulator [Leptospira sp.]
MKASLLESLLGRLLNHRVYTKNRNLFQARLVAAVLVIASVTAFATGIPLILMLGDPSGFVTFGFGIFILILLIAFRLGLETSICFVILEISTGIHFLLCRAMQDRIDWPLAVWLTIFPILRLLYGGFRHGLFGIGYSFLLGIGMYLLESYSPFERVPVSEILSFERGVSFMIAIFIITAVFNALRMEAMSQAEQAANARTLFLANMSHELRTPMNGVIGITELILSGSVPDEIRNQLALVHRSGSQMLVLINNILDLTRLESMKLTLESLPISIKDIIEDVIALLKPTADQKQITLSAEIESTVPDVCLADPLRLKQIITNLIGNAVKFTPNGYVTLKAQKLNEKIQIQIIDTGIGISEEVRERIFFPFEQADVSFTRRYGGSGLGLAISQRLVALMGGKLSLRSNEGNGSIFSFDFEFTPINTELVNKKNSIEKPETNNPKKVLLVEDNDVNLFVALGMLKRCGCKVESRSNGKEALEVVQSEYFDLVLMDCHMPVMDGFEATRQIRKLPSNVANIPIVALTASAMAEDIEACLKSGMNDVITKPLSFDALRKMLQSIQHNK